MLCWEVELLLSVPGWKDRAHFLLNWPLIGLLHPALPAPRPAIEVPLGDRQPSELRRLFTASTDYFFSLPSHREIHPICSSCSQLVDHPFSGPPHTVKKLSGPCYTRKHVTHPVWSYHMSTDLEQAAIHYCPRSTQHIA